MLDYRSHFPLLSRQHNNKALVYFDNAATTPKPELVIEAVNKYYREHNANIHRGPNFLAEEATDLFEDSRKTVAQFIGADHKEIIFTSGATAAFNLLARVLGEANLKTGDVVAISQAEHHANIVPWLQLKEKIGIELKYIKVNELGDFETSSLDNILNDTKLRILSLTQASNVLGHLYDLKDILARAKERGVITIVDEAQSIAHHELNVKDLGADFVVFSGHKLFAPSGIGVLYGRFELLDKMPTFFGGGSMISEVKEQSFQSIEAPYKFEAGTPNIEGVIGLGAACRYLQSIGWELINQQEEELAQYFLKSLEQYPFLKLLGGKNNRLPLFSLVLEGAHPHDMSDLLGEEGIITRAGHHCAQPLHESLGINSSLRVSLAFYNTTLEIDYFFEKLIAIKAKLS
ncbi:MAG: SufS family cysteine desulfurase [Patescibacteria group bacterium]|jgi:cysteine desulfurase/selenocysteine lyase|nr:SufS family cysteine desulfurase [Patescibacteria group bacterium]